MCQLKCSLCLLALPKESLGYCTHGRLPRALFKEEKAIFRFTKNQALFFPKNLTLYWAPKDFKSSSIIGGFFFTGVNKFGFHEFQYKGALNYQHNYSTQTLSSNSWYVAGISQVNKARFKRRTFNTCAEPNTYLGRPT